MFSDEDQEGPPSPLQKYIEVAKRGFTIVVSIGVCMGIIVAIWHSLDSGNSGFVSGLAEGAVFLVCIWAGFLIGYLGSRGKNSEEK